MRKEKNEKTLQILKIGWSNCESKLEVNVRRPDSRSPGSLMLKAPFKRGFQKCLVSSAFGHHTSLIHSDRFSAMEKDIIGAYLRLILTTLASL